MISYSSIFFRCTRIPIISNDPCGNKYNYSDAKSIGLVNLHLIDATGTIRIGTCTEAYPNGVSCKEYNEDMRDYLD